MRQLRHHPAVKTTLHTKLPGQDMRLRVELKYSVAIGPGKADILEGIRDTGSLAEAARRLGMSYQRVWTLVGAMNQDFVEPLVETQRGGASRGGACLTETGHRVLDLYREAEQAAVKAVGKKLPALVKLLKPAS